MKRLNVILLVFQLLNIYELCDANGDTCSSEQDLMFQCANGDCIKRKFFCNETSECLDGSDEIYNNTMNAPGIMCRSRQNHSDKECLLPAQYQCDHELDCMGGNDECNCPHTFLCDNGDCALKVSFCDNLPLHKGCPDGTDEKEYNRTAKIGFQCPVTRTHVTKVCVLPDRYVCDGDSDCDFGIDECFCDFSEGEKKGKPLKDTYSNDKCFRCLDGSLVIPNIHLCDGIVHCEDLSDECLCPAQNRSKICDSVCFGDDCGCPGQIQCVPKESSNVSHSLDFNITGRTTQVNITGQVCLESTLLCNDQFDCENKLDEIYCALDSKAFECYDGSRKIKWFQVCNGPSDCDDGSDEIYCHSIRDHYCTEYRRYFPHIEDWDNVQEGQVVIPPGTKLEFDRPFHATSCDGIPTCTFFSDECNNNCPVEQEYCSYLTHGFRCPNSGSLIIGVEICDGKPTCNDTAPDISADEFGCPGRFYCTNKGKTRLPIHIPEEGKCNRIQECDDQSDELNCSTDTHFYCEDGGSTLFVPIEQVCDDRKDCEGGGDECQNCNPSPFSSDKKLISSRVLIFFLWAIGIIAVFGNTAVIIYQILNLIKPPSGTTPVAMSNRILVLNLSISDLLVGIYLVALGIKDASVSEYCLQDQEWRSSSTCSALGSIALIGTETSVFILLIMTTYRLYLVVRPFKTQRLLIIGFAIVLAWTISFVLAFVPLAASAQDYFVSCVWYRTHHFVSLICKNQLQEFTSILITYEGVNHMISSSVETGYSWENMFEAMRQLNVSYEPERWFGYYSAHSVCLPRLFPDRLNDNSWGYSMFLILINFFAFLFILISYVYIYRTSMGRNIQKARAEERATSLQRKVTRIVLTDFCCWMPICIIAFIKVSGSPISDVAYAVTAIILLPINSAMNPFLYSDILDIIWDKWFSKTSCGRKVQKRMPSKHKLNEKPLAGPTSQTDTRSTVLPSSTHQSPRHGASIMMESYLEKKNDDEKDHEYYAIGPLVKINGTNGDGKTNGTNDDANNTEDQDGNTNGSYVEDKSGNERV